MKPRTAELLIVRFSQLPTLTHPVLRADTALHREWLVGLTGELDRGLVVDLGCGKGEDLSLLAARHNGSGVQLVGVDASATAVGAAKRALGSDARVFLSCARLDEHLPFAESAIDVLYSHNLLECLIDPFAFAREAARVLRPGALLVVGHWDWDSQLFDGPERDLVRRLVHAFADWKQAWMANSDGWMGRRLWGVLDGSGYFEGSVVARVVTNTDFEPGCFGYDNAQAFAALARRGIVPADDVARFLKQQASLAAEGRYFYSITGFAYLGRRVRT